MKALTRTAAALLVAVAITGPAWMSSSVAAAPGAPAPSAPAPSGSVPVSPSGAAVPSGAAGSCAVSGFTPRRGEPARALREQLRGQAVNDVGGTRLEGAEVWVVPLDSQPFVVVDSVAPLTEGTAQVYLFGIGFRLASGSGAARQRYISGKTMPHLGSTVRVVGIRASSNACDGELVVMADRSVFNTVVGRAGLALAALLGALMVWVARRRAGGWARRFALAAPLGLLAGAGEAAVLQESGVISPFSRVGWALPVLGLLVAAVLPLTRRRPAQPAAGDLWRLPDQSGYRVDGPFTRTAAGQVDRATRQDDGTPVLLKTVRPELVDDAAAALRLAREAEVAGSLDDQNCLRLLADLPGASADAAPVLVFEHVDGAPARHVLDRQGPLTGPQSCLVLAGVLRGLAAVHAAGFVHRDVRPENVLLGVDGRVLLAGFEVAAPGEQNAVVAEGEPPYAGPQQRSGGVIDGRADLWAAGVVLGELITGQVLPLPVDGLPDPVAALIAAATADDPDARPSSAQELRVALEQAAEQAYGPDWMSVGALTGAVLLPGGVIVAGALAQGTGAASLAGSGAAGAVGAGATGTGAVGAGAVGTGVVGAGAVGAGAVGAGAVGAGVVGAGAAGTGVVGAGAVGAGAVGAGAGGGAVAGAGSAAAGGGGATVAGKLAALVTPALVVATVATVALTGAADAAPPAVREVITPEAARVIFVTTVAEARSGSFDHVAQVQRSTVRVRFEEIFADAARRLDGVGVGVPRGQVAYPAHFLATASVTTPDGVSHLLARFDRSAADQPWLMTSLHTWKDRAPAPLRLAPDGYLAQPPSVGDLIADPERLPVLYLDWFRRSEAADTRVPDPLMVPFLDNVDFSFIGSLSRTDFWGGSPESKANVSLRYSDYRVSPIAGDLVPFADGTVLATFSGTVHLTYWNAPGQVVGLCATYGGLSREDPNVQYQRLDFDFHFSVEAWIPVRGASLPGEPASPAPVVTGTTPPRALPKMAGRVSIDDGLYSLEVTDSQRC